MNITALVINLIALILFLLALIKDRKKAIQSVKIAMISFLRIMPMVLIIVLIIGMILGFLSSETISNIVSSRSGIIGVFFTGLLGAFMHIPAVLAFPLSASFLEKGASITAISAFITTLTMVGLITLPLEIKMLGKKFALLRNIFSFIVAILIAYIMGSVL